METLYPRPLLPSWSVCLVSSCQQLWCHCPCRPFHRKLLNEPKRSPKDLSLLNWKSLCWSFLWSAFVLSIQLGLLFRWTPRYLLEFTISMSTPWMLIVSEGWSVCTCGNPAPADVWSTPQGRVFYCSLLELHGQATMFSIMFTHTTQSYCAFMKVVYDTTASDPELSVFLLC